MRPARRFVETEETFHFFSEDVVLGTNEIRSGDVSSSSSDSDSSDSSRLRRARRRRRASSVVSRRTSRRLSHLLNTSILSELESINDDALSDSEEDDYDSLDGFELEEEEEDLQTRERKDSADKGDAETHNTSATAGGKIVGAGAANPLQWHNDVDAAIEFLSRLAELPETSLMYEPIDVSKFADEITQLLEISGEYARARDAERSWLCCIGDSLYCRTIVMPGHRVDRIRSSDLEHVQELVLAPNRALTGKGTSESSVYAMVTDGADLFTIRCIDTHKKSSSGKSSSSRKHKSRTHKSRKSTPVSEIWEIALFVGLTGSGPPKMVKKIVLVRWSASALGEV
uniref:Uncharacterized protein n=1 Tax=Phytophthora ramorum TaxID=164328 RepID=H3HCT4_PHYRM